MITSLLMEVIRLLITMMKEITIIIWIIMMVFIPIINSMTRDAGFIVVTQQISHYMIATYEGLIQFSLALGEVKIACLLEYSLEE